MGLQYNSDAFDILDIRRKRTTASLLDELGEQLRGEHGKEKQLPTILLYDERGLKLFEEITYLEEYYLTNAEIEVLQAHSDSIAKEIPHGAQIIELGSGNLRKVSILLHALERAGKSVDYYALDLSLPELKRTLSAVRPDEYHHVRFRGLYGTYDDGLAWLKLPENAARPRIVLFLGSSIGNFPRPAAASFLRAFSLVLGPHSKMLIGLDACQDEDRVYRGYNDREGKTREFYMNGLAHANVLIGKEAFRLEDWDVVGEYDNVEQRHQAFYTPLVNVTIEDTDIRAGERVRFEESYKYSSSQAADLWKAAGLAVQGVFGNSTDDYHLHLLASSPPPAFPLDVATYAARPVPSAEEFQQLWNVWDFITTKLIPKSELLSKPIRLRNCCIFYLGHIPTFMDLHVSKATRELPTGPPLYYQIFERGIDPDVDNPEQCHKHSEIPDTWPPLDDILAFRDKVRDRVISLHENGTVEANPALGRSLWLSFEHEAMHVETLLYMLVQSDKVLPPGASPDFKLLSKKARREAVPNEWIKVPSARLTLGLHDPDDDLSFDRFFGWDNEKPKRYAEVSSFEAKARPLTNEDYARYLDETRQQTLPALWTSAADIDHAILPTSKRNHIVNGAKAEVNGQPEKPTDLYLEGKFVKTMYGPVPLKYALDWPVMASYDELYGCAKWMGGRIPTAQEVQNIYAYVDMQKGKEAEEVQTNTIAAVNGHLSNNGVEETPPSRLVGVGGSANGSPDPHTLFTNLEHCNVGFKSYHPTPVTQFGNKLAGRSDLGGVWEWTSTVMEKHEGFEPMKSYPGYTADFFDGKHNVVLGGSWATHPRIAGRKTFLNWYQRNYPFAWAGARIVRDIATNSV